MHLPTANKACIQFHVRKPKPGEQVSYVKRKYRIDKESQQSVLDTEELIFAHVDHPVLVLHRDHHNHPHPRHMRIQKPNRRRYLKHDIQIGRRIITGDMIRMRFYTCRNSYGEVSN